jgi:hypothetical protein
VVVEVGEEKEEGRLAWGEVLWACRELDGDAECLGEGLGHLHLDLSQRLGLGLQQQGERKEQVRSGAEAAAAYCRHHHHHHYHLVVDNKVVILILIPNVLVLPLVRIHSPFPLKHHSPAPPGPSGAVMWYGA